MEYISEKQTPNLFWFKTPSGMLGIKNQKMYVSGSCLLSFTWFPWDMKQVFKNFGAFFSFITQTKAYPYKLHSKFLFSGLTYIREDFLRFDKTETRTVSGSHVYWPTKMVYIYAHLTEAIKKRAACDGHVSWPTGTITAKFIEASGHVSVHLIWRFLM